MSLYWRIAWFNFGTYLAYPFEIIAASLRPVLEFGFVILFWTIVAASSHTTISISHLLSYFLLAEGMAGIFAPDGLKIGSFLAKEIKRGRLSQVLIKPVNPLRFEFAQVLGNRGIPIVVSLLFFTAGIALQPPRNLTSLGLFVLYLPVAAGISVGLSTLMGSTAFYTTESSGVRNVVSHTVRVFSGQLVPLYLFPSGLRLIATSLPFSAMVYGPAHALQTTALTWQEGQALATGLIWSLILLVISLYVWRRGLKSYEAVGI
jgi:ABC-2 type transport system permease protein